MRKGGMRMDILVLGGSRLIGYCLLPLLVNQGHRVTVITRGNRPLPAGPVAHIPVDRADLSSVADRLGEYHVVIDNIAYVPDHSRNLLEVLHGRTQHYVATSTAFVYPEVEARGQGPARPLRETDAPMDILLMRTPTTPHDQYVYDKQRLEYWLRHAGATYGIPITVLRPLLQIVGPNTEDGRFAWFWLRVADGGVIWLPDDARHKAGPCQLAFSGDVAQAIAAAVYHRPPAYAVYNVGQPELWTYEEYLRLMAQAAGTHLTIRYAPRETLNQWVGGVYRIPLPYAVPFDVSAAERELGVVWTPMADWIAATGVWASQAYRDSVPPWYGPRPREVLWPPER